MRRKIFLVTGSASLLGALIAASLVLIFQRQQCIANTRTANNRLVNVVQASLMDGMLDNDWGAVDRVVQTLADEMHVESIQVLDRDGRIKISAAAAGVGQRLDQMEGVSQLGQAGNARSRPQIERLRPDGDHTDLVTTRVLYNQRACQACHSSQTDPLGFLMIVTPLSSLQHRLSASVWRILMSAAITFILLVGVLTFFLRKFVLQPVDGLRQSIAAIEQGNLNSPLVIQSEDELGALAQAFERMRVQLQESRRALERQNQELQCLNQVGIRISATLDFSQILDTVAAGARQLLDADVGVVGLWDEAHQAISVQTAAGAQRRVPQGMKLWGQDTNLVWPIVVERHIPDSTEIGGWLRDEGIISILAVPLRHGDRLLGSIQVMMRQCRHFPEREIHALSRLANQVAAVIENARLHQQIRYVVTLEERERLAREMHDRLAQTLGYLNIKMSVIEGTLSCEQIAQTRSDLQELEAVVQETYVDVREAIFNLRTTLTPTLEIIPTLQQYLADYRVHYGLTADLIVDGAEAVQLAPEVSIQLLRIVQEALTNVRKHAQASRVWVHLRQAEETCWLTVEDNGRGFELAQIEEGSHSYFGLQIMRERAEGVGGNVQVESRLGAGTRVVVQVPTLIAEREG